MNYFYFNECIPQTESYVQYTTCLENSLREYYKLKNKHQSIDGIVTEKQPAAIGLCPNFTLKDCILALKERELKRLALRIFTKFPVEAFMSDEYTDQLLENEYKLNINKSSYDALNLALTSLCGGILFTLALHKDLRQSPLALTGSEGESLLLENLYGTADNSDYLSAIISEKENANASNLIKLKTLLGECKFSDRFEKEFENMSFTVQQAILEHFKRAKSRKLVTPFSPGMGIVKDVTPVNAAANSKVYELRIFTPLAIRIYFREQPTCVYIASIGKKAAATRQSGDIALAQDILDNLEKN